MSPTALRRLGPAFRAAVTGVAATALVLGAATAAAGATPASTSAPAPAPAPAAATHHTVTYDHYSFAVDGKRTYLWSGEFHYYRLPSPDLWRDVLQKMKAAGFNATSLYFDWGYHSPRPGVYDFTGVRDVDYLLDIAAQVGIYVIARPGPYINAEVDGGGFPAWLGTQPGRDRSTDPTYLHYADEWLTRIDRILQRHLLTKGTGSVIAYQVENEFYDGSPAGRAYMTHLENKARADGIDVPLTGNNNGTFNDGAGALDVDGPDSYPQGFNCSNPTKWNGVPDLSYDHPADAPLYTPEFQGGAFDPWGGPGYPKCAQLINDQFANVFYKQNIAVGATAQSFYMLYGGTSWGWSPIPQNYTSYDYGAAITEARQLDPKYAEDKRIGYFTHAVAPLTKTDPIVTDPPSDPAVVDTARANPDDHTQFHVLRHADSTSTTTNSTHISLDFGARSSFTYDDTAAALRYAGTWTHVGAEQSYTGGDYQHTESFSATAGDSVTVPFTGTAVRWISSKDPSHGIADVYLDGTLVKTVDGYAPGKLNQQIFYSASGLTNGPHTLKIVVTGRQNAAASSAFVVVDAVDVPPAGSVTYPSVPQRAGTGIVLNGRESKIITANYQMGGTRLQYSTSEIMTHARIGNRDVAVLYGDSGQAGETVLHYAAKPTVRVLGSGGVSSTWDAARGDLRLNYTHSGLRRVLVTGGDRPLLLLIGTREVAATFWQQQTASGPVLVRGSHLLRTATSAGSTLALTGDTSTAGSIEVFSAAGTSINWNGRRVQTQPTTSGGRLGVLPGPAPVHLPGLTTWKHQQGSPETQPGFNDSSWATADKTTTNSSTTPSTLPVLFADDYGFHTGDVWYRGRFRGTGNETGINLTAQTGGTAGAWSVWLNGRFLGTTSAGQQSFTFPAGSVHRTADNVVSVVVENMGHDEDYNSQDSNKSARGLTGAVLTGAPLTSLTWRIQGNRGGEHLIDPTRGPLNTGGLYGERQGWSLPGFPDQKWQRTTLPTKDTTPGVSWYRTDVNLRLPKNQDTSLGLKITDDPSRHYRALIYVNGWLMGRYVNNLGPQTSFPIPNGILRPRGKNSIAIAVWNTDASTGGLGRVSLQNYGSVASSLKVADVTSPHYDRATYASPTSQARLSLAAPDTVQAGQTYDVSASFAVPTGDPTASDVRLALAAPAGWTVRATSPTSVRRVTAGTAATATWTVATPGGTLPDVAELTATARFVQRGTVHTLRDARIVRGVPAAPSGDVAVSSLPFLSASNGWGPVERDMSNGENLAGDGKPITLNGTVYAKGLGTNSVSDVALYTGGRCSRFTATVGVDDEVGSDATVTFSVLADGKTVTTTPVLTGSSASVAVSADVTGAQVVDLVVGDGGDGNGRDHADWADPVLHCG